MTRDTFVGVMFLAHAKLRFGSAAIQPGDIFEIDEADIAAGADPAFWLSIGAVERYEAKAAPAPADEADKPAAVKAPSKPKGGA